MKRENSLTNGPIPKGIVMFAMPILLGQIFQQLYNTADAMIVGQYLNDQAYAAVSSSGSLVFLLIGFFVGISIGAGVVISHYYGAQDKSKLQIAIHTTVTFGIIAGLLMTLIGVALTPQILRLMGTPNNVIEYSVEYFRMYFAGSLAISMYNLLRGILQAVGDSRHPLYYLIASSIINIVLDFLFIGVLGWGVWSAALATTISQFVSAILCLIKLMTTKSDYRIYLSKVRLNKKMFAEILHNGIPSGLQNSIIAIANVVVQKNINHFGDIAMAGSGTYAKLEGFAFLPITCFTMALTTFVSQNLGANKPDRVKRGNIFGIICCVVMAEVIGVLLILFDKPLIHMFTDTPASVDVAANQIHIEALFFCLLALSHCIASILRGAGWPTAPMFVMLGVWCILRVTYISIAVPIFEDIRVVFSAYPLTWTISSIIFIIIFLKTDWINTYKKITEKGKI